MNSYEALTRVNSFEDIDDNIQAYTELLNLMDLDNTDIFLKKLLQREAIGDIQITEGVVLPHLESKHLKQSSIQIVRFDPKIKHWNESIKEIDLMIVILLKRDESNEIKKLIKEFIFNLADESFIKALRKQELYET